VKAKLLASLALKAGRRYFLGSSFFSAGGGVVAPLGAFLEASSPHAQTKKATAAIESSDLIMNASSEIRWKSGKKNSAFS
jgi:hypothetical protein